MTEPTVQKLYNLEPERWYRVTLNENDSLSIGARVVSHTQEYQYHKFDLSYIKLNTYADDKTPVVAKLTSMIKPQNLPSEDVTLKITFIPAQKISALLGE